MPASPTNAREKLMVELNALLTLTSAIVPLHILSVSGSQLRHQSRDLASENGYIAVYGTDGRRSQFINLTRHRQNEETINPSRQCVFIKGVLQTVNSHS